MGKTSKALKRRFAKAKLVKGSEHLSFKDFIRRLKKEEDQSAIDWFFHKSAKFNQEAKQLRIKSKGARIASEKLATKNARRKSKVRTTTTTI